MLSSKESCGHWSPYRILVSKRNIAGHGCKNFLHLGDPLLSDKRRWSWCCCRFYLWGLQELALHSLHCIWCQNPAQYLKRLGLKHTEICSLLFCLGLLHKVQDILFANFLHQKKLQPNNHVKSKVKFSCMNSTSCGPPGLWLAVKMKAPYAFSPCMHSPTYKKLHKTGRLAYRKF